MHPIIYKHFRDTVARLRPNGPFLEIGSLADASSLLAMDVLAGEERVGINMCWTGTFDGFDVLKGNGNSLDFADRSFGCVLTNATLEHDLQFWRTIAEIRRVLRPGGLAIIGVPGFGEAAGLERGDDPARDTHNAALTFRYHADPDDYYRFSASAVRDVFFEGYSDIVVESLMHPPRFIGHGSRDGD